MYNQQLLGSANYCEMHGLFEKAKFANWRKHLGKVDKDKKWAKITEEGENSTGQNYLPFLFWAIVCAAHMN